MIIAAIGHGKQDPKPDTDTRNIILQGGIAEQEKKRLCQQLKEAETEIQLYNIEPRNRAERRAKTKTKTKKKAGRNTCR